MRFILVDRILRIEKGKEGSFVKNVSHSEDYFSDHFPESPIMPGVLILESFDQASQCLVSYNHDFTAYPELQQVARVSFRHYVVPGDQLQIHVEVASENDKEVVIKADAHLNGKMAAEALMKFGLVQEIRDAEAKERCRSIKSLFDLLASDSVGRTWEGLACRF